MVMWVRNGHVDPLSRGIARRSSPQDGGGGWGGVGGGMNIASYTVV